MAVEQHQVDQLLENMYDKFLKLIERSSKVGIKYTSNEEKEIYFFENMHSLPEGYIELILEIGNARYRDWVIKAAERYIVERELFGEHR